MLRFLSRIVGGGTLFFYAVPGPNPDTKTSMRLHTIADLPRDELFSR